MRIGIILSVLLHAVIVVRGADSALPTVNLGLTLAQFRGGSDDDRWMAFSVGPDLEIIDVSTGERHLMPRLGAWRVLAVEDTCVLLFAGESQSGEDLNGDGDQDDIVQRVEPLPGGEGADVGACDDPVLPPLPFPLAGNLDPSGRHFLVDPSGRYVLLLAREDPDDLNGDGDTLDIVPHVLDLQTMELWNTGLSDVGVPYNRRLTASGLAVACKDEQDKTVPCICRFESRTTKQLDIAMWVADIDPMVLTERYLFFGGFEMAEGRDLNGDGDTDDVILYAHDLLTAETSSLGFKLCTDYLKFRSSAEWLIASGHASEDGSDPGDDGCQGLDVAVRAYSLRSMDTFLLPGGVEGWSASLSGDLVAYTRWETQASGDLDGDGRLASPVVFVGDLRTAESISVGMPSELVGTGLSGGRFAFFVNEPLAGADLNGDGDTNDDVLHLADLSSWRTPAPIFHQPIRVGLVGSVGTNQVSGMAPVTGRPGTFWVHNDRSDGVPRIFAIREDGTVVAQVTIAGASLTDWEDIATGPGPEAGASYLYIADTGTNVDKRSIVSLWQLQEPVLASVDPGQKLTSEPAVEFRMRYPNNAVRDTEALVVDPASGTPYLLTKLPWVTEAFRMASAPDGDGVHALELVGSIPVSDLVTAAAISPDGRRLLIRTYSSVLLLERPAATPFEDVFVAKPEYVPSATEIQSEAITWDHEGLDYLTTGEGAAAPIFRMYRKLPQDACGPQLPTDSALLFVRGDIALERTTSAELAVNVADAVALRDVLAGAAPGPCPDRADLDDNGLVDGSDLDSLLDSLVRGRKLMPPFPDPGMDPTGDELGCHEAGGFTVLPEDAEWAYWLSPEPPAENWRDPGADLEQWPRGPGGVGFGSDALGTVVASAGAAQVLYARTTLAIESTPPHDAVAVDVDFAHGFVLYLNGVEVARRGLGEPGYTAPPLLPAVEHRGGKLETLLVCGGLLAPGRNVLAIEVHGPRTPDGRLFFRLQVRGIQTDPTPELVVDPPEGLSAALRVVADGPLIAGQQATLQVVLDATAPIHAASFVLSYDRGLKAIDCRPAPWLAGAVQAKSRLVPGLRRVEHIALIQEGANEGASAIGPGVGIPLAEVTAAVVGAAGTVTTIGFTTRTGQAPWLSNAVAVEGARSLAPITEDLEALVRSEIRFHRGDSNADGTIDISDPVATLGYLFLGGPGPTCLDAADVDDSGALDISDAVYSLGFQFLGGPPPPEPFAGCGTDPTDDALGCEGVGACP